LNFNRPEVFVQPVKLVRLGVDPAEALGAPVDGGWKRWSRRLFQEYFLLFALVMAPTAVSAIYFLGFAADRYESEAKFVVRSPATNTSNQLSGLVQGSSIVRSSDDAYIVKEFILSRDASDYLAANAGLLTVLGRPEADFLWRYPSPFAAATRESLFKHYLKFVSVDYDQSTGVADLRVQGFRPADAQQIAQALIARAELLINGLNERSGADAVKSALAEVEQAERRAHKALAAVTEFRSREKVIDPAQASLAALNTIASLSLTTAEANASLIDAAKATPGSPQVATLSRKIAALQDQIAIERSKLAGGSDSLAPRLAEYEGLILDQTFAEKAFLSALTALETARIDAQRQRVFLESVSSADLPDYAAYPHRALWILVVFATGLLCWRIVRTLVADTRSHTAS
jgi:capsular polysaccharide transport system permease protein